MHFPYAIIVSAVLGSIAIGQTLIDLKTQSKSVDFTAASTTKPFKSGVVLPPVCSISETFFKTDALPGSNWYACTALNTWTLQSGGVMTGDVSGPITSNLVNRIQGRTVSAAAPSSGQTLVWSGVNNRWEPGSGGSGLSVKINGGAAVGPQATLNFIPGMGLTGYSAVVNGSQIDITQALDSAYLNTSYIQVATLAALGTGLLKNTTTGVPSIAVAGDLPDLSATYSTKTAGGDLSGTLPSPTVGKIQGKATDTPTTKGDLFVYDGSAIKRLGVGSDNQVLTADTAQATGVKWAAPGGGSTVYPGAGFGVSTGSAWGTSRAIAQGAGITVTNGDGLSGNPTIAADTAVIMSKAANASGTDLYVSDTSGNTTYAGCPATYTIAAYTNGMRINFRPNTSATTTATLNLCTLGTKSIFQADGTTNPGSQLGANKFYTLTYDSTLSSGVGAWRMTQGDSAVGGSYVPMSRTVNGHALSADVSVTASDVGNGMAQWNANQLQGRAMASTAPSDTNVICWDNAGTTWKPCAAGAHTQNTDTGTTNTRFQIDSGNSGPRLKNNAGVLEIRNSGDTDYADLKAKSFTAAADPGGAGSIVDLVEGTTATSAASHDICYADSTDHLIKCSWNNGAFAALLTSGGALGTPASGTLTNATGLPISTGVSGLGTGVATFLGTPSGANLASALTTVLPANGGGTNNGYFQVSGPATSAKTFTFPNANATITQTIASGQTALPTGALSANTCSASATTATATGALTTDAMSINYASDPTGVTGYGGGTSGGITVRYWLTAGTANFKLCNETGSSITPGTLSVNWRVTR